MRARLLLGIALAFAPIALLAQGQVTALYTYPSDPEGAATCLAQADNGNLYGGGYVFNPAFPAVAPSRAEKKVAVFVTSLPSTATSCGGWRWDSSWNITSEAQCIVFAYFWKLSL